MEININISNYEEFLLSAVDGELSGDEMMALEAFLLLHPHIREELALLESIRLTPDPEISFDDKAQLYRQVTVLSATNYESQLLDYIDNELHGPEKQALELLIKQHPHIRQELNILKQSRLQPDLSLRFENKAVLYKNNRTKVRPIWWWSAAAVVTGLAVGLFAPSLQPRKSVQVAVNTSKPSTATPTQQLADTETASKAAEQNAVQNGTVTASKEQYAAKQSDVAANAKQPNKQLLASNTKTNTSSANTSNQQQKQQPATITTNNTTDNSNSGLTKLTQPEPTSGEIVQQLQEKIKDQQLAAIEKAPVMANAATTNNKVSEAVTAAAPVQGELVVSVTMNGDSKLLNGVANVARFFSKKKK